MIRLYRFGAAFAGSNSNAVFNGQDKDFAVADSAAITRSSRPDDRSHRSLNEVVVDRDLYFYFADKVGDLFRSAVDFRVALLSAETLHVHDGKPKDFLFGERFLDGFKTSWLDDRDD